MDKRLTKMTLILLVGMLCSLIIMNYDKIIAFAKNITIGELQLNDIYEKDAVLDLKEINDLPFPFYRYAYYVFYYDSDDKLISAFFVNREFVDEIKIGSSSISSKVDDDNVYHVNHFDYEKIYSRDDLNIESFNNWELINLDAKTIEDYCDIEDLPYRYCSNDSFFDFGVVLAFKEYDTRATGENGDVGDGLNHDDPKPNDSEVDEIKKEIKEENPKTGDYIPFVFITALILFVISSFIYNKKKIFKI